MEPTSGKEKLACFSQ